MKPVVIDLCCGLGGWSAGFLAEGWDAIGFDIEKHEYGDKRYPGHLILKSILQINGYDLRAVNPALVVASPPCREYSYMAMPWQRGKRISGALRGECPFPEGYAGSRTLAELTALYDACLRIAWQIGCPIVLENVRGAQPWVGRAKAHFGSYYLWGDVADVGGRVVRADAPAFGSFTRTTRRGMKANPDGTEHGQGSWFAVADSKNRGAQKNDVPLRFGEYVRPSNSVKVPGMNWSGSDQPDYKAVCFRDEGARQRKNDGGSWFAVAHNTKSGTGQNPVNGLKTVGHVNKRGGFDHTRRLTNQRESDAVKQHLSGPEWFDQGAASVSSKSDSRKAASAMIAEIPFELASYVARAFKMPRVCQK